jgi:hypothetical protein
VNVCPAIVSAPLRAAPVFDATLNETEPLPVPLAPPATVIQAALDVAVHAQLAPVVTATVPLPPVESTFWLDGEIEKVHAGGGGGGGGGGAAAACDTVNVWPAIVSVPLRAAPLFVATAKLTVPFPLPDAAPLIEIHEAFDAAVHAQPLPAVTATEPLPPLASTDWLLGAIAKLHGGGTAACVTVSVSPAIVSVPLRAAPGLAVAV